MAPARKKGKGGRGKGKAAVVVPTPVVPVKQDWTLGELVLAKVKGHPPWPAKVTTLDDTGLKGKPSKVSVRFFATKQVALVAFSDLTEFTFEQREKYRHKTKGKGQSQSFVDATKEICAAFDHLHGQVTGHDFLKDESDSDVREECVRNEISEEDNFVLGGKTEQCVEAFSDQDPEDLSAELPMIDEKEDDDVLEAEVGVVEKVSTENGNSIIVLEPEEVVQECALEDSKMEVPEADDLVMKTNSAEGAISTALHGSSENLTEAASCGVGEGAPGAATEGSKAVDTICVTEDATEVPLMGAAEIAAEDENVAAAGSLLDLDDDPPISAVRRASPQLAYRKRPKPPAAAKPVLMDDPPCTTTSNGASKVDRESLEGKSKQVRKQKKTLVKTSVKEQTIKIKRRKQVRDDSDEEALPEYVGDHNKVDGDEPQEDMRRDKRARRNCTLKATPKSLSYSVLPKQKKAGAKTSKANKISGMPVEKCTLNFSEDVDHLDDPLLVPERAGAEFGGKSPGGKLTAGHESTVSKALHLDIQKQEGELVKSELKLDNTVKDSAIKVSGGGVYQRRKQGQKPQGLTPAASEVKSKVGKPKLEEPVKASGPSPASKPAPVGISSQLEKSFQQLKRRRAEEDGRKSKHQVDAGKDLKAKALQFPGISKGGTGPKRDLDDNLPPMKRAKVRGELHAEREKITSNKDKLRESVETVKNGAGTVTDVENNAQVAKSKVNMDRVPPKADKYRIRSTLVDGEATLPPLKKRHREAAVECAAEASTAGTQSSDVKDEGTKSGDGTTDLKSHPVVYPLPVNVEQKLVPAELLTRVDPLLRGKNQDGRSPAHMRSSPSKGRPAVESKSGNDTFDSKGKLVRLKKQLSSTPSREVTGSPFKHGNDLVEGSIRGSGNGLNLDAIGGSSGRVRSDEPVNKVRQAYEAAKETKQKLILKEEVDTTSSASLKYLIAQAQAAQAQAKKQARHNMTTVNTAVTAPDIEKLASVVRSPLRDPSPTQRGSSPVQTLSASHDVPKNPGLYSDFVPADSSKLDGGYGPGQGAVAGSREGESCGEKEKATAREAFEGMLETLSRAKDSIGRATRHAIECAKYGIADQVVEVIMHKLEVETSFRRRLDLFFLVDSITQCSLTQKGAAGASYPQVVQVALPRLLNAAAPPGLVASENRRQCLKVLSIWLDRKILPVPVVKHFMKEIEFHNDDKIVGSLPRRPSRAERAVDDPLREMEGMFVDEYGSNASFAMPGFVIPRMYDDDEDACEIDQKQEGDSDRTGCYQSEDVAMEVYEHVEKHRHVLEDVDGELEMEDVSPRADFENGRKQLARTPGNQKTDLSFGCNVESPCEKKMLPPLPSEPPPPPPSPPPLPQSPPPSPPPPPPPPSPPCSLSPLGRVSSYECTYASPRTPGAKPPLSSSGPEPSRTPVYVMSGVPGFTPHPSQTVRSPFDTAFGTSPQFLVPPPPGSSVPVSPYLADPRAPGLVASSPGFKESHYLPLPTQQQVPSPYGFPKRDEAGQPASQSWSAIETGKVSPNFEEELGRSMQQEEGGDRPADVSKGDSAHGTQLSGNSSFSHDPGSGGGLIGPGAVPPYCGVPPIPSIHPSQLPGSQYSAFPPPPPPPPPPPAGAPFSGHTPPSGHLPSILPTGGPVLPTSQGQMMGFRPGLPTCNGWRPN